MSWQRLLGGLLLFAAAGCTAEASTETVEAAEWGRRYATTRPSGAIYACSDCHTLDAPRSDGRIALGAPLGGVTQRPDFWGGAEPDLLAAINHCRYWFQSRLEPWPADSEQARALYAYLDTLPVDLAGPVTFEAVQSLAVLPHGDPVAGKAAFSTACGWCHGKPVSGQGRLVSWIPRLPQDTFAEHPGYTEAAVWAVFVEKVRHGPFWGYGGVMPPFGRDRLSDEDLGDILAYLASLR